MPKLMGDGRRLRQILMNLIRNAIKFTTEGFIKICIKYENNPPAGNKLFIDVIDSGSGIAKEDMSLLFTRFGKLQRTANINNEGIGLGLNIVK